MTVLCRPEFSNFRKRSYHKANFNVLEHTQLTVFCRRLIVWSVTVAAIFEPSFLKLPQLNYVTTWSVNLHCNVCTDRWITKSPFESCFWLYLNSITDIEVLKANGIAPLLSPYAACQTSFTNQWFNFMFWRIDIVKSSKLHSPLCP